MKPMLTLMQEMAHDESQRQNKDEEKTKTMKLMTEGVIQLHSAGPLECGCQGK